MDQGDDFIDSELKAIDHLVKRFEFPLQSASANTDLIKPEFEALLSYAGHFIQLPYMAKLSRGKTFAVGIEKDRSRENVCSSSISQ